MAKAADSTIEITVSSEEILKQIDDITSKYEIKLTDIAHASCIKEIVSLLSHELSQPLMVINAYASGCIRRMAKNDYNKNQIIDAMKTINYHVDLAGKFIHHLNDLVSKVELHYRDKY